MIEMTLGEIAAAVGGEVRGGSADLTVTGPVEYDSRKVKPGGLFVASDSLPSEDLLAFHEGDTYVPLDPEGVPDRLARAGFVDVDVRVNEFGWAARARAQ